MSETKIEIGAEEAAALYAQFCVDYKNLSKTKSANEADSGALILAIARERERKASPWRNFREQRPEDGQECWIWRQFNTRRGVMITPVTPAIYADGYFKGDGDYYYLPEDGILLWMSARRPSPPAASEIEAAMKGDGNAG